MTALVTEPAELTATAAKARERGGVGLVPTMGALHAGHRALLERAKRECETVICTIYVNPLQFQARDDLDAYPRDLDADLALLDEVGIACCFAPTDRAMYPSEPEVSVDPGPLGEILEGASRPGHFRGVATVVTKLFSITGPSRAYFGEKDYQQLVLVRRLVRDLSIPVEIVGCETVRESDGLALSSRNVRLSAPERAAAPVLHRALLAGAAALSGGASPESAESEMAAVVRTEPLAELDYGLVRSLDLGPFLPPGAARLLAAVRLGAVRLIDNLGAIS